MELPKGTGPFGFYPFGLWLWESKTDEKKQRLLAYILEKIVLWPGFFRDCVHNCVNLLDFVKGGGVEQGGWNICDLKSRCQWDMEVSSSINFPSDLGLGRINVGDVIGGVQLCTIDANMNRSSQIYCVDPSAPKDRVVFMLATSLRGDLRLKPGGHTRVIHVSEGNAVIYPVSEPNIIVEMSLSQQKNLDVGFTREFLQQLGDKQPLPQPIRRLAEGKDSRSFAFHGRLDGHIRMLIKDFTENSYSGSAQRIYQEAKGLEMFAMLIDALDNRKSKSYTRWKRRDVELLHEAKARLMSDLENSVSLAELANFIGMSTTKLKLGFREVLGTTVTETLRKARLELAKNLLVTTELPLKVIASKCGYCDASSLSHAFTHYYKLKPGDLRRS